MAYGKLTPPKKEMNDDFESEMMEEEMDMDLESDESNIASVLAPFSKEEIEEYLISMDSESDSDEDMDSESDEYEDEDMDLA